MRYLCYNITGDNMKVFSMEKNKRELCLIFGIIFSVSGLLAMFYPYRNITSFDFKAINEILERLAVLNLFGMFFAAVGLYMLYHLIKPPTLYTAKVIKLGQEYIDGKVVEENFISDAYKMETAKKKGGSFTVKLGEKEYFVMGDNRKVNCSNDNYCSFDSRSFGSIRYEDIRSRGLTIIGKCKSIEGDKCVGKSFSWPKAVK